MLFCEAAVLLEAMCGGGHQAAHKRGILLLGFRQGQQCIRAFRQHCLLACCEQHQTPMPQNRSLVESHDAAADAQMGATFHLEPKALTL